MPKESSSIIYSEEKNRFPVAGIGASAGGLEAFKELVRSLPATTGIAYIILQHFDAGYESALQSILQKETTMSIQDLQDNMELKPDTIHVIPANKIMATGNGNLQLQSRPAGKHPIDSIDRLFTALSDIFQSHAIGILLSGTGTDGTNGLKKIKENGGVTFAQAPVQAKYPGMPQHAINSGAVDFESKLQDIPAQLGKIAATLKATPFSGEQTKQETNSEEYYYQISALLRLRHNVDFTHYKQSTIRRRILRRILVTKAETLSNYLAVLEQNVAEQDTLYQDLLIPVTAFFRDTAIFDSLCGKVFPEMFESRNTSLPVRIWVAGCSTGEEAYSLAICLHEFLGDSINGIKLQLFATDISEKAIQKARTGIYTKREAEGVSAKRLQQYFTKTDGHYQVKKTIRDLCVFATHNFLKDPPFAKMDLITCRNVLIYMGSYLQKKALATFHYSLNEKGVLLLGKSETASNAADLFKVLGKQEKLYSRKPTVGKTVRVLPERVDRSSHKQETEKLIQHSRKQDFEKNADDILLAKYTPVGVVVNEQSEIVQFKGATGAFLEAASGKASLSILKMAREGLSFEIRNALHKARETRVTAVKNDILINGGKTLVNIEVVPLLQTIEPHYLILFTQAPAPAAEAVTADDVVNVNSAEQKRIQQLEKDLTQLREDMRTITEDQEAANEELQSANEELLSGSEELQSLNEELETSKEELQSTNEELMTVNQELYDRKEQYNQARLYSEAIISTIREPLLVLNRDLRIKSANNSFYNTFGLSEDEITGRILFELQESRWDLAPLRTQLLKIQTGQLNQPEWEVNFQLPELGSRTYLLNALPVKPETGEQLILLAFKDITLQKKEAARLKENAEELEKELKMVESFFQQAPALFCILRGADHVFEFANPRYLQVSGARDLKGKTFASAFPEFLNIGYKDILDQVYQTGVPFSGKEMKAIYFPGKTQQSETYIDLSCQAFYNEQGTVEGVLFFCYEVTELVIARQQVEKNAEQLERTVEERTELLTASNKALEESNHNLEQFASIASHDLQEPLRKIKTFIAIIKDKYREGLPAEGREYLGKTQAAAERMSALIKGVLNYSRLAHPENNFTAIDLNSILNEVLHDFELVIKEKKAAVKLLNPLPVVNAIGSQMHQLFYNLVGNALKFTDPQRTPLVEISCDLLSEEQLRSFPSLKPGNSYYQLAFRDNGIGFDETYEEQIFSIFERLDNNYEGTGIGLPLCRKIVTNHGGVIWAKGRQGQGTIIFVILPLH